METERGHFEKAMCNLLDPLEDYDHRMVEGLGS